MLLDFRGSLVCVLLGVFCLMTPLSVQAQDKVRMLPPDGDGAKYWPRWRGPSGQGLGVDGPCPDKWSDTENVLWKVPMTGRGNSSPIIWEQHLFLTTAYENGKRRSILCFDRTDGKKLWETFVPEARPEKAQ